MSSTSFMEAASCMTSTQLQRLSSETEYLILSLLAGSGAPYIEHHDRVAEAYRRFDVLCRRSPSVSLYYRGALLCVKGDPLDFEILELHAVKEALAT